LKVITANKTVPQSLIPLPAAIINGAGPLQTFKSLWERDKI
jgi:hypothetical protein